MRTFSFAPPANATMSSYRVPHGASTFLGSFTPSPVTVVTRSMSGLPSVTASAIAATVPTFSTTHPTAIGSPPSGTMRFTVA